jgi:hypothetical protein
MDLEEDSQSTPPVATPPPGRGQPRMSHHWLIFLLIGLAGAGFYVLGTTEEKSQPVEPTTSLTSQPVETPSLAQLSSPETSPPLVITSAPETSPPLVTTSAPTTMAALKAPDRTVLASGGLKLSQKSSYSCTAQAPADWNLVATDQSNTADLFAPAKSAYAGYGIQAVNTTLVGYAGYYAAPLNDPDLYSSNPATVVLAYGKIIASQIGGSADIVYTAETNEILGDYTLRSVASSTHRGVIFYHTTGFPGDGYNYSYAEPMYFAFTTNALWASQGLLVAQIAAGIRCSTQFQPRDQYVVTAKTDSGSSSDANGSDAGYNPQLGTEYVHDPGTGENYLVSPSTNWSETGPQGAGYYTTNGNDYTKLEPGRSD